MLKKLNSIYPLQLEIIPLLMLFFLLYLALSSYPGLPDQIPTHFNIQGLPDKWGSKNEMLIYPGMGIFIYALFTGITAAFLAVTNPLNLINLPSRMKESISPAQAEELRILMIRTMLAFKILIIGLMVYLLNSTVEIALHRTNSSGYWPLLFVLAILILVGYLLFRTRRVIKKSRKTIL
jgi:uncharacterized membrane protein